MSDDELATFLEADRSRSLNEGPGEASSNGIQGVAGARQDHHAIVLEGARGDRGSEIIGCVDDHLGGQIRPNEVLAVEMTDIQFFKQQTPAHGAGGHVDLHALPRQEFHEADRVGGPRGPCYSNDNSMVHKSWSSIDVQVLFRLLIHSRSSAIGGHSRGS